MIVSRGKKTHKHLVRIGLREGGRLAAGWIWMGKLLFPSRSACLGGESKDSGKGIVVEVIVPPTFPYRWGDNGEGYVCLPRVSIVGWVS